MNIGVLAGNSGYRKSAPLQQLARSRSEAVLTLFGVQQGDPLNGASVRFRFGLPEGWTVKLSGPFEVEVLRIAFQLKRIAMTRITFLQLDS